MFQEHRFRLKVNVSIITYGNCRYKIKGVSVQNTKQYSLLEYNALQTQERCIAAVFLL